MPEILYSCKEIKRLFLRDSYVKEESIVLVFECFLALCVSNCSISSILAGNVAFLTLFCVILSTSYRTKLGWNTTLVYNITMCTSFKSCKIFQCLVCFHLPHPSTLHSMLIPWARRPLKMSCVEYRKGKL